VGNRPYIDFEALRKRVRFESVLAHFNIRLRQSGAQLRGQCPLPSHTSNGSRDSFFINVEKNVYCCHSDSCKAASGRNGGNILDFVAAMNAYSVRQAAEWLVEVFPESDTSKKETVAVAAPPAIQRKNKALGFRLKDVNPEHPRIQEKGISIETARVYGIGFFPGKGSMQNRIVFELWESSELIGYAGRTILEPRPDNPKWKVPANLVKSFVYGLERCDTAKPLILGESLWLPPFMQEKGMQAASLMGAEMTPEQEKCLDSFNVIWLSFDSDDVGKEKAARIRKRLEKHHTVRLAPLRE
jgi:DNA primase